jgi:hypothetical protein
VTETQQATETLLADRRGVLIGPPRLSAPVSFGCLRIAPALIEFLNGI